jgi:hypothetical protein
MVTMPAADATLVDIANQLARSADSSRTTVRPGAPALTVMRVSVEST